MLRRGLHSTFLLSCVAALSASTSWAGAPPDRSGDTTVEPPSRDADKAGTRAADKAPIEVRIVGSRADALQRVPGSSHIVTAREVRRAQPLNPGELLRRVPGLTVRSEDGMGLRLNIGIRGFDSTRSARTLVLEDGVPIALNPYGEPDLYYSTPVERIRAIEVVKGSGSILFGPQSVAGAVNLLTLAPPSRESWWVDGQYGQYAYRRVVAGYGNRVGETRYVVQAAHKAGDGFRGMDFQAMDVLGKVAFPTSSRSEATLKLAGYDETSNTTYVGMTQPMFVANRRGHTVAPHDRFDVRRYDITLTHELQVAEGTRLRTLLFGHATSRIAARQDFDRAAGAGAEYERIEGVSSVEGGALYFRNQNTIRDRAYQVAGLENILEQRVRTGPFEHTFTAGLRLMAEGARRQQRTGNTPWSQSGLITSDERTSTLAIAGYLQDRIEFRDDLLVTPGIRLEHASYSRNMLRDRVQGAVTDVDRQGDSQATAVLPGIGMVAGTPSLNAFGGAHAGFSPPRIASAISTSGADAHLSAERSINYEVGGRARIARVLRLETAGFLVNFINQIVQATPAFGAASELVNGGRTRHLGVESGATLGLGQALRIPTSLDLALRHTFVRAVFAGGPNEGNRVPYSPSHIVTAIADLDMPWGLGGQLAWHHVTEQFADERNTVEPDSTGRAGKLDGYDVIDLGVRYRWLPARMTASLLVKNALDDVYISSRRPDGIFTAGFRQLIAGLRFDNL